MKFLGHLLLMIMVALLTGAGVYLLDQYGLYFIVLIPLGIAAILSTTLIFPAAYYNPPKIWLFIVGIVGIGAAFGAFWGIQYNSYLSDLRAEIRADNRLATLSNEDVNKLIADYQEDEYGFTGFQAFVAERAEMGFTLDLDPPLEISGQGAYIYWAIEMLVVIVVTLAGIFRFDSNPYVMNIRQNQQLKQNRMNNLTS